MQSHLPLPFFSSGLVQPSKVVSCSIHDLSLIVSLSSLLSTTYSVRVSTKSFPLIFAHPSCPSASHGLSILVNSKSASVKVCFSFPIYCLLSPIQNIFMTFHVLFNLPLWSETSAKLCLVYKSTFPPVILFLPSCHFIDLCLCFHLRCTVQTTNCMPYLCQVISLTQMCFGRWGLCLSSWPSSSVILQLRAPKNAIS